MARPPWKRYVKPAVKAGLAVVVLWALGRHVGRTWTELRSHGGRVRLEPAWLIAGALLYLAGLTAFGVFFAKVMASSPSPVGAAPALRAYLISHLGKYVPGKAMVVVMRVGLVVPHGARPATAAFATVYETLVMMAAGAMVGAAGFGLGPGPVQALPIVLGVGLTAVFLVVVAPAVFPRVATLARLPFPNVGPDALPSLSGRLLAVGLLWSLGGWALLGLSQLAVIRAVATAGIDPGLWPLVTASVALATVAGFVVAVLPGGLGVREGVLIATLTPALGDETAVVASLTLRLTWVAAEAGSAALLWAVRPATPVPPSSESIGP